MKKDNIFRRLIKHIQNYLRNIIHVDDVDIKENIESKQDKVSREDISNKDFNNISFRGIFEEKNLKAIDKFYLIYIMDQYNPSLGYSEVSNKELMRVANCKNNNTVCDVIDRLCEKGVIRKLIVPKGHTNRYLILRYSEYLSERKEGVNSQIINKIQNANEIGFVLEQEVIDIITLQNKIIEQASKDIIQRVEIVNREVNKYIKTVSIDNVEENN